MLPAFNAAAANDNKPTQEMLDLSLLRAAEFGENEKITDLIRRGADKNARHINGDTPMIIAAREGHEKTVRLLLLFGADTAARNNQLESAEGVAHSVGHPKIAARIAMQNAIAKALKEKEFFAPILEGSLREITTLKPLAVTKRRMPKPV